MSDKGRTVVHLVLTASPLEISGRLHVLLTLEDLNDLVELSKILPICSHCKKIREGEADWQGIEHYLAAHLPVSFSHSFCDACLQERYPAQADE